MYKDTLSKEQASDLVPLKPERLVGLKAETHPSGWLGTCGQLWESRGAPASEQMSKCSRPSKKKQDSFAKRSKTVLLVFAWPPALAHLLAELHQPRVCHSPFLLPGKFACHEGSLRGFFSLFDSCCLTSLPVA